MDFYKIKIKETKGVPQAYPDWVVDQFNDLMVRGGAFYAVWDEELGMWSKRELDVQRIVDADLKAFVEKAKTEGQIVDPLLTRNFSTGSWERFTRYISKLPDEGNYHSLDDCITFENQEPTKKDYVSKTVPYSLMEGRTDSWDELLGVLYSPEERDKIEWSIGAIVSGDSKWIQKFLVFYGAPATGKSTVIGIIEKLFEGYTVAFEAKALTSANSTFAMEVFQHNPLVAIQHDGDLSKIEDNSRLNSIVGHDTMNINVKYRSAFSIRPNAFLIMGTNQPVKISDAKAGNTRRLIDVHPTGAKIEPSRYHILMENINFELGAIAHKCLRRYREMGKFYYENYVPTKMMLLTDTFYNFIEAHYDIFKASNGMQLKKIWELYKQYCEEANITKRLQYHELRSEAGNYFEEFRDRYFDGQKELRSVYLGFKGLPEQGPAPFVPDESYVIELNDYDPAVRPSVFNNLYFDCPAQEANTRGNPRRKWANVTTTLEDIDPTKLHFVKVPERHIVIDFDITDENGDKDLERNIEEASKLPPTYTELSKSGKGLHLHYIYNGDVQDLASMLHTGVEIKTLLGDSSLRRKLTKCNNLDVMTLGGGLPRKEKRVIDAKSIQSEKGLRELIERNLRKEIHPGTKPSIDFIHHILEESYNKGLSYDVRDMRPRILGFAANSSHHSLDCIKVVQTMQFLGKQEIPDLEETVSGKPIIFFDVEVYKNLFVVCWKIQDREAVVRMINPTAEEIEPLFKYKLVGFNNRRYDNHILYARFLGYSNEELFELSQRIIFSGNQKNSGLFGPAYELSYADIYDFMSSPKKGLKKLQIELGIHHQEIDIPWEEPVPNNRIESVVEYCVNDVISTEAVFNARYQDFVARQILSELSGLSVNHTTQQHTGRIIFGEDKNPQKQFRYTDLSEEFPGYFFDGQRSFYGGLETGEGGYVYSKPGYYQEVAVLDIASMHPTSIIQMDMFGPYTAKFKELVDARIAIKRKEFDKARKMLDGKMAEFLIDAEKNPLKAEDLAYALKIVINSVYGYTSASFENLFRDNRNKDNIVAKRGALFMIDLKNYLEDREYKVIHIKTDSIKIPYATPTVIQEIIDFGLKYGYEFEHEITYDKMCLINDAVYIACKGMEWTAVGAQFQHPYVFKTLFSHEEIEFDDLCETKSVSAGRMYLDWMKTHKEPNDIEDMRYVGQTGSFVPVKNGGVLYRVKDGKTYHVTGTKGYEWIEREVALFRESEGTLEIDMGYFEKLKDDAIKAIEKYQSYERFVS